MLKHSSRLNFISWLCLYLLSANTALAQTPAGPYKPTIHFNAPGTAHLSPDGQVKVRGGIVVHYQDYTLSSNDLDGNLKGTLTFTGNAHIEGSGISASADLIRFRPSDKHFALFNVYGSLKPSLFNNQILQPVNIRGGNLYGDSFGDFVGDDITTTTCIEPHPHYDLHIAHVTVIAHKKIVLHRVSITLFNVKLITLPTLTIPLVNRLPNRPRVSYFPEFGQNQVEGYYVHIPYEYAVGDRAAGLVQLNLTQKLGPGYRLEQEYAVGKQQRGNEYSQGNAAGDGVLLNAYGYGNAPHGLQQLGTGLGIGPTNGGLIAIQGYFGSGYGSNFTASIKHQQSIGGSNHIAFDEEIQRNSGFVGNGIGGSYTQTTSFQANHNDAVHGNSSSLSLNLNTNSSSNYTTAQLASNLTQTYQFDSKGSTSNSLTYALNFTHLLSTTGSGIAASVSRTAQLNSSFTLEHIARDYQYTLDANDTTAIGPQTGGNFGGSLEKLPELTVDTDTISYKRGWLRHIPTDFTFGYGMYSEGSSNVNTDRFLMAFNLQQLELLKGHTEIVTQGGVEQRFYGDGAAEYRVHDITRLRQHLLGRSGIDLTYTYDQPEGATPFLFDQLRRSHYITMQAGYLEDSHFQLTAGTGYDLSGQSGSNPWQVLTTQMMWHPNNTFRLDTTQTFNPNTGHFYSLTNLLRFRGPHNLAIDIASDIDPNEPGIRRKLTSLSTQFSIPFGRNWRILGLLQYNGLTNLIQSSNLQITHNWDCLTASLTYTNTQGGFAPQNSIFFTISLTAFPVQRAFARGPLGQSLGAGTGGAF